MNFDIVESFAQMVRDKGIDKDVLGGILEEIFGLLVKKKYGEEAKFDVVVNMDRGDIEIFLERTVVDQVTDPNAQIRSEEHTSELQSLRHLVCRLLLEKKKKQ